MKILVTGAAGFIGSKLSYMLAQRGNEVIGIDNINDYYDVRMKYGRLKECGITAPDNNFEWHKVYSSSRFEHLQFIRMGIEDRPQMEALFREHSFDKVVNLAAQAGVRYSIVNPYAYLESNLQGFLVLLECCRNFQVPHLIFASSSSVYGLNQKVPYQEEDAGGQSGKPLCGNQEEQRAHGTLLQQTVWLCRNGAALFHRLWSVGTPGYGSHALYQGHPCRRTHQDFQSGQSEPRLHLYR